MLSNCPRFRFSPALRLGGVGVSALSNTAKVLSSIAPRQVCPDRQGHGLRGHSHAFKAIEPRRVLPAVHLLHILDLFPVSLARPHRDSPATGQPVPAGPHDALGVVVRSTHADPLDHAPAPPGAWRRGLGA